jgi:hypothetical protein
MSKRAKHPLTPRLEDKQPLPKCDPSVRYQVADSTRNWFDLRTQLHLLRDDPAMEVRIILPSINYNCTNSWPFDRIFLQSLKTTCLRGFCLEFGIRKRNFLKINTIVSVFSIINYILKNLFALTILHTTFVESKILLDPGHRTT